MEHRLDARGVGHGTKRSWMDIHAEVGNGNRSRHWEIGEMYQVLVGMVGKVLL